MLDRIDRAILRLFLKYRENGLTTNQIANKVQVAPRTAKKHLDKLEEEGYLDSVEDGEVRHYQRK